MKLITIALGLTVLALVSGCESDEHHHGHYRDDYRGGAYTGPEYPVYGHGDYRDPRFPDYQRYPESQRYPDYRR